MLGPSVVPGTGQINNEHRGTELLHDDNRRTDGWKEGWMDGGVVDGRRGEWVNG